MDYLGHLELEMLSTVVLQAWQQCDHRDAVKTCAAGLSYQSNRRESSRHRLRWTDVIGARLKAVKKVELKAAAESLQLIR